MIAVHVHRQHGGEAVGGRGRAGERVDLLDQIAALQIHDIEHGVTGRTRVAVVLGVVVAVTEDRGPVAIVHPHDSRLAEGVAEILVVGIGKLPQHAVLGGILIIERRRIGDIERVDGLTALAQSCHKHAMPAATPKRVGHGRRTIDEKAMVIVTSGQS